MLEALVAYYVHNFSRIRLLMSIQIICDCGKRLRAKEQHRGKRARCPGCGKHILIPCQGTEKQQSSVETSHAEPTSPTRDTHQLNEEQVLQMLDSPKPTSEVDTPSLHSIQLSTNVTMDSAEKSSSERLPQTNEATHYFCEKCGRELQIPTNLLGHPEVCKYCMHLHFSPDAYMEAERERKRNICLILSGVQGLLWCAWIPLAALHVFREYTGGLSETVMVWTLVTVFTPLFVISIVISRLHRVWLLYLNKTEERRALENCKALLEQREQGKFVSLCGNCGGTGVWGWLIASVPCMKCNRKGYIRTSL